MVGPVGQTLDSVTSGGASGQTLDSVTSGGASWSNTGQCN